MFFLSEILLNLKNNNYGKYNNNTKNTNYNWLTKITCMNKEYGRLQESIPLDHIHILHSSSSDPIKEIYVHSNCIDTTSELPVLGNKELERHVESYNNDHDYICKPNDLFIISIVIISNFPKEVATYNRICYL